MTTLKQARLAGYRQNNLRNCFYGDEIQVKGKTLYGPKRQQALSRSAWKKRGRLVRADAQPHAACFHPWRGEWPVYRLDQTTKIVYQKYHKKLARFIEAWKESNVL